jgi:S1-C subfamily serine protease
MKDLVSALSRSDIGQVVSIRFLRRGTEYTTQLRLEETPVPVLTRRR